MNTFSPSCFFLCSCYKKGFYIFNFIKNKAARASSKEFQLTYSHFLHRTDPNQPRKYQH